LFVDDANIARSENVTRRTHAAQKLDRPVLEGDKPWENGRVYIYGTTHRDPATGEFRMWYGSPGKMLYATSPDGLHWTKPELDVADYDGQPTNIVIAKTNGGAVVVDEIDPDPARRYKALIAEPIRVGGFQGYVSADGIHWTPVKDERILTVGSEMGHLIRDPATRKYFAYIRPYPPKHFPKSMKQRRLGAVATSEDFVHWSEMQVCLTPDAVDDAWVKSAEQRTEFYAMNGFAYGRSYLGIVPLFRIERIHDTIGKEQSKFDGPMEGQLIASRDGLSWQRLADRNPVIPSGRDWDRSIMNVATTPIVVGDEVWHYYTAINTTHGSSRPPKTITLGLAKRRLDGFVSLDAGPDEAIVETTPIAGRTGRLEINATPSGGGSVTVEVVDVAGKPLAGYAAEDCIPLTTDAIRHNVRWKQHETLPSDAPFRLRFRFRNASLYSYTIVPD
jgi:hypothetical protein